MSLRSGDRARAHKVERKRRFRRTRLRLLRKLSAPALENGDGSAVQASPAKEE